MDNPRISLDIHAWPWIIDGYPWILWGVKDSTFVRDRWGFPGKFGGPPRSINMILKLMSDDFLKVFDGVLIVFDGV